MRNLRLITSFVIFFALLLSCSKESNVGNIRKTSSDQRKKYLNVILEVNTPGYYLDNGMPTGYHYEMLKEFAQNQGYILRVTPFQTLEKAIVGISKGDIDVLAIENPNIVDERVQETIPHWKLSYSLISFTKDSLKSSSTLFIPKNLFVADDLSRIKSSFPNSRFFDGLNLGILMEHLISNKSAFAIVQENMAYALSLKYSNLKVSEYSSPASGSWYVSRRCKFLYPLNEWIASKRNTGSHSSFYSTFYQNYKVNRSLAAGASIQGSLSLSSYDANIKQHSKRIGWDWLLVSSLIYQESKFRPHVESGRGAKGLMQVMPATANHFGFNAAHSPETNIYIGTKLLSRLTKFFSKYPIPVEERNKFVLAAYNGGASHVVKAMGLAFRYGRNPYRWDDVALFIRAKRGSSIFDRGSNVDGYKNSNETTRFVVEVLSRYNDYKTLTMN